MTDFPYIQTRLVNAENVPELAGFLSIFTVPVLVLFADGKELMREARFIHIEDFKRSISKIYEGYYSSESRKRKRR